MADQTTFERADNRHPTPAEVRTTLHDDFHRCATCKHVRDDWTCEVEPDGKRERHVYGGSDCPRWVSWVAGEARTVHRSDTCHDLHCPQGCNIDPVAVGFARQHLPAQVLGIELRPGSVTRAYFDLGRQWEREHGEHAAALQAAVELKP